MDQLKHLAQVCRQHFEKIFLTVALLVLAGAVWILYQASQQEEHDIQTMIQELEAQRVKDVTPADLSGYQKVVEEAAAPLPLDLSPPHHLLNPVRWQRKPDGSLIPIRTGKEVGPHQLVVSNIVPLRYRITLDKINSPGSYYLGVQNEAATNASLRLKVPKYAHITDNRKNNVFTLLEAKGPPENPELVLELADTQEQVTVSTNKPFERIEGYLADLKYKIDGRSFTGKRKDDVLRLDGEDYKIVAITAGEVVLSALLNDKKYTVTYAAERQ